MSRLDEIRARLAAAGGPSGFDDGELRAELNGAAYVEEAIDLLEHAPADLAYLLDRLALAEAVCEDCDGPGCMETECSKCGSLYTRHGAACSVHSEE